jgi:hypothetical protein
LRVGAHFWLTADGFMPYVLPRSGSRALLSLAERIEPRQSA